MNKKIFSMAFIFLFSLFLVNIFANTPEIELRDYCNECARNYHPNCEGACYDGSIPNPTPFPVEENNVPVNYPITFDLEHSFSSSQVGTMYMALISPLGEVILSNQEDIGNGDTTDRNTFDAEGSYTDLFLNIDSQCEYGSGDYNLLVHTNPIFGKANPFTAETNLYSCSSIIDLLNEVNVPQNWLSSHRTSIYCSIINEETDVDILNVFTFDILEEAYSGCVIKNENLNESVVVGYQYGSEIVNNYDEITFNSIESVQEVFGTGAICTLEQEGYLCVANGKNYIFNYVFETKFFEIHKEDYGTLSQPLSNIVSYSQRVDNPNSESLLINNFKGVGDGGKMIVGYEVPSSFFRENYISEVDAINIDSSFDFDSTYVIHYKNFGNIEQYCYDLLRGQSLSTSENNLIEILTGQIPSFNSNLNIACYNDFIFINSEQTNFITLYKNLVFDTVFEDVEEVMGEYSPIFAIRPEDTQTGGNDDSSEDIPDDEEQQVPPGSGGDEPSPIDEYDDTCGSNNRIYPWILPC